MNKIALSVSLALAAAAQPALADDFTSALSAGKVSTDMNLRYENVSDDSDKKDADALTLRTRLTYSTGAFKGFSATIGMEDVRVVAGVEDYNAAGLNGKPEYSVIADPETTELDQGFVAYGSDKFSAKLGRQVIAWDGQRFVGHVGWRQDRQTFDALSFDYTPMKDLALKYAYIDQRNRIFAEERDINSKDHLFNASYKTSIGTVTGYGYLLEEDNDTENQYDTFGVSFKGAQQLDSVKVLYAAEFAKQNFENAAGADFDTDYYLLEGGVVFNGITFKLGYEVLGSDDGMKGFQTPLATLHKFQGWADQFLSTPNEGVEDIYVSATGKLFGGKWVVAYHDFSADESSDALDDLGSELDLLYAYKWNKVFSSGIKFAAYSADDYKVDTDKLWIWTSAKF
ncbi:hypothetical protein GCM10011369_17080 [Neiella marina]|uniref:Alginate export domain-containing protein n=1 Tax=Neiella marina TaxID=508461 RepID=A0A8J2U4P9_9GAMM|nr:alginate export family protein [Neiella marina]GGA75815.1 hypothetical protein GCM10011369_17080 [Neiella marina]